MREPNQPTPLRASFTVVAPQGIPHGHPIPPPNVARSGPPQQQQIESLLHTLESASTQRIDLKLQHLKDFFKNYDELATSPAYLSNAKTFIGLLIRLLNETVAHYVVENETHELRKLILEALFRMSFMNENVRQYAKEIQKTMLNVILHDNEENALLALKIIIDHLRVLRLQFTPEIANFFSQVRLSYRNFVDAVDQRPNFFHILPTGVGGSIEEEVQQSLPSLYFAKTIHMEQRGGTNRFDYTILPRSTQSVRVFSELPSFLLSLNQLHRQHIFDEVVELLPVLVRFLCVYVPPSANSNKSMVDEFHTAQIRALNFIAFIAKNTQMRQQNYAQRALHIIEEHADQLTNAINQLLECLNPYAGVARREFIMAIKLLFESDLKHRFVGIVQRLTSDQYLLGEKFTSQDHLRYALYHNLADLLYKIRSHLTYPMLLHAFKVCIRCIHDSQLLPNYQMMYLKLMRSLCDPIIDHENRLNEPAREVLILSLESLVKKLEIIADYYIPALAIQLEKPLKKDPILPVSPQKDAGVVSEPKSEVKDVDGDQKQADSGQSNQSQDQAPTISPSDCRNMVKLIFLPAQEISARLAKCHLSEPTTSIYAERELFERFFSQSIRCLEVFKIVSAAAAQQTAQLSTHVKSSLAKDEKETVETFASVFQDADPRMFQYIFRRQISFFIDSFIANPSVQLVCKLFLMSDKTFTTTGSILMKHMLNHMSELGSSTSSDKTQVYLRLFREIFHIVSGINNDQQPQRITTSAADRQARSKEHEAMLIPYLHQIVSDSIQLALRSRDPQHYFALLHALFRSIGTGSHDQLYQQFLPLLPSILQQLNRFQNGSYRQPIHDLYVELCLTVPVRLSSLLPYLPLLMDPLVCALHGPSKLVMQGLRTLELFVNNLQLDYVYDQMLPVRGALMQGIWRALYTQEIHYAMLALKILGKLGGSSRRAFQDAQNFTFVDLSGKGNNLIGPRALYAAGHSTYEEQPPKLSIYSTLEVSKKTEESQGTIPTDSLSQKRKLDNDTEKSDESAPKRPLLDENGIELMETDQQNEQSSQEKSTIQVSTDLPMAQIVESALSMIRSSMVNEPSPPLHINWAHWLAGTTNSMSATTTSSLKMPRQQAVEVCKRIVLQAIENSPLLKLHEEEQLKPIFKKALKSYQISQSPKFYHSSDSKARAVVGSALTGIFYAAVSQELRPQTLSVYRAVVSHLALQALLESMSIDIDGTSEKSTLDAFLLIDVICQTLSDSCKHFCQAGIVALRFINILVKSIFDSTEELNQAYELPFFRILLERVNQLTYRRDWYAKLGGCTALRFFVDNFTREFVIRHSELFLNALFTTIAGLADEVSYSAVDVASKALDQFLDVCFDDSVDETALNACVSLISSNLANAEQQLRNEANRLLSRLQELTKKSKRELLESELPRLKKLLVEGFAEFSSMSIGSQMGFLDFFAKYLKELQLAENDKYAEDSEAFISNLMTIIQNTDIALHSMPSSRYSITNLPGSPHSLEDQMKMLRNDSVNALRQHVEVLLLLKSQYDSRMSQEDRKLEMLKMALTVLDIERIQTDPEANEQEKQLERMRWTVKYAYELAELDAPQKDFVLNAEEIQSAKNQILKMTDDLKSRVRSHQSPNERDSLIKRLDVIVDFLLKITIHPIHPIKNECRNLLKLILDSDHRFKFPIHVEIHRQLCQMQPIAVLNDQIQNPENALKDLSIVERLKFMPHATKYSIHQNNVTNEENGEGNLVNTHLMDIDTPNQQNAIISLNLNEPIVLEALLEGQLAVQIKDRNGQIIAVGETIEFGPVDDKSKECPLEESALTGHFKKLNEFELDTEMHPDKEEAEQKKSNHESMTKREVFAVIGRKDDKFQFSKYDGPMPPKKSGTFVTLTTLSNGQQFRSIRNYSSDLIRDGTEAIDIYRQVGRCVEEAAELQHHKDLLLVGGLDTSSSGIGSGRSYSMSFNEEVDEATKAQLHKVANMLMLEAQSLGLDQPSSYTLTVRPSGQLATSSRNIPKRRTSSGVSASDFQELMDMSDTDLREIGEEIIQQLPDFRSPEKPTTSEYYQQPQEVYMDPVQEVVASMRADAQKQMRESQQQQESASYGTNQQIGQYAYPSGSNFGVSQPPVTSTQSSITTYQQSHPNQPYHSQTHQQTPMPHHSVATPVENQQRYEQENGLDAEYTMRQQTAYPLEQEKITDSENKERTQSTKSDDDGEADEYLLVNTKNAWKPPIIVNVPVAENGRADFSKSHVCMDNSNESNQLDDEPVLQQSKQPFNPILLSENGEFVENANNVKDHSVLNDGSADQIDDARIDCVLNEKEGELKSKQQTSLSCSDSDDSFEYVCMEKDGLNCSSSTRCNKIKEKVENHLEDLAQKYKKVEISNDVLLTIKGVNSGQLKNLEIQSEALELMNNQNKAKQLVLKANEGEVEDEGVKFNDLEIIQDDGEDDSSSGPYSYVTEPKLRKLFNHIHAKSPSRAEEALEFYVNRMKKLLNENYTPKVETDDSNIRLEYAHESVRLPTGHVISTLPRVHFNYLPEEVFEELKTFDQVEDEMLKEVNALADQLHLHPTINDDQLEQLFEYQSVNSHKLSALADLRSLIDARIPPRLLNYLAGEIGQIFKLDINEEINDETLKQLENGLRLMESPDQTRPIDFLLNALSFIGALNENLDINEDLITQLIKSLTMCLNLEAEKVINHVLGGDFLQSLSCRRILCLIFNCKEASNLRYELLKRLPEVETNLAKQSETPEMNNNRIQVQIDYCLLQLIQIICQHIKEDAIKENAVALVHRFWCSEAMEKRYTSRKCMFEPDNTNQSAPITSQFFDSLITVEKFRVPELCVRILIEYVRERHDRIDLLYDCCSAFCHEYATDFTFFSKFIEDEIVCTVALEWRHQAFKRMIDFFKPRHESYVHKECVLLAKFIQHVLIPCFQHAFNTCPIDDVVGSRPWPNEEQMETSIIWQFCLQIIDPYYHEGAQPGVLPVSETLKTSLYQFCSMLVQRCPDHIHNSTSQRQRAAAGNTKSSDKCLRSFMLFCWHCIQSQNHVDLPEKYAGQFLMANLMEKFAINKNIMNQAIGSLLAAHYQDTRSIVGKSLEIIIPVIASRGDGSDLQLFQTIKDMIERTHQHTQGLSEQHSLVIHCVNILTRHFKVFFRVRQQIAELLMHTVQRLYASQPNMDNKRLVLEICETILRWENQRKELLERAQGQDATVDRISQAAPLPSIDLENLQVQFDRRVVDQLLQWLLRIATSTDQGAMSQNYPGADPYSLVRKALIILRRAIKPQLFGNVPLRTNHLERQLTLPQQRMQHEEMGQEQQAAIYNQVTQTLDIILALVSYLVPESIADFMQNLQRPVAACVSSTNMSVAQSCFKLIGKLAEQTASTGQSGLAEFEYLNSEIARYLNESMNFLATGAFSQQMSPVHSMQLISKCLALLRVICKFHPTYLESTCFVAFLKMFQRLVLEYDPTISLQTGISAGADPRHKIPQDLCSCMDLLKGRLHVLNTEARRAIDKELQALVDKPIFGRLKDPNHQIVTPIRRVVEKIMETLVELVRLDAGSTLTAPMGLKLLVHTYERMQPYAPFPSEIMLKFLSAVQIVFEDRGLRKSELAEKLHQPFFWGLAHLDQNVWFQFFCLFESQFPSGLFERFMHIISDQNWLPLRNRFWIPHCIHLLLRSSIAENSRIQFKDCSTFAETAFQLTKQFQLEFGTETEKQPESELTTQVVEAPITLAPVTVTANATDNASSLDSNSQVSANELFLSGKTLSDMLAKQLTNTDLSCQLTEMSQVDQRLARTIFSYVFSSIWNQIPEGVLPKRQQMLEYFLQSGQCSQPATSMPITPLNAFFKASRKCTTPKINIDALLIENIAVEHGGWFDALEELELQCRNDKNLTHEKYSEKLKRIDSLMSVYSKLGEDDLKMSLWKRRACLPTTYRAIQLYNQGLFKEARFQSRLAMSDGRDLMFNESIIGPQRPSNNIVQSQTEVKDEPMDVQEEGRPVEEQSAIPEPTNSEHTQIDIRSLDMEMRALESVWTQSCRELNDWSTLTRYANCNDVASMELLSDAAWHQSEWGLARDLVVQMEAAGSRSLQFSASLLQAKAIVASGDLVQRIKLDELGTHLIGSWRQLPSLVTPAHMNLVRMAQRVQEVTEANQINKVANDKMVRYPPGAHLPLPTPSKQFPALLTHRYTIDSDLISTIKQTVKTWRNRPLTIIDPASHWSDTFTWRVQEYWTVMKMFENADSPGVAQQSQVMHPLHSISQAQINYARTLRKSELYDEAAHELSMLHVMSQVHPIDAGMALHEHTKCLIGLAEKIKRQRKYGEQCVVGATTSVNYLGSKKEPEQLIQTAIQLLDSARLDVLSNDQLARLLAVKASLHSYYDENGSDKAEDLFAASARLIETSTAMPIQQSNVANTMAASQLVWKHWSLHWERRFNREFESIWKNGEFDADACREVRKIGLETITTLLECMRTATDYRSKKFAARFFNFLRTIRALEDQLKTNRHPIQISESDLSVENVLQKHAGAVSAISWLFWLEQIVHEIRNYSSKEMSKILCSVADSYPQQVLTVLRHTISPEIITERIKFIQQKLPLISDWIRCAPPLDVTSASNESPEEAKSAENPYEQSSSIDSLERNKEEFADAFTLWRSKQRDRQLIVARQRLLKFNQTIKELELDTNITPEAKKLFDEMHQRLKFRYLRLKHMQKHGILVPASLNPSRCLNMSVPFEADAEEEIEMNEYKARIRVPQQLDDKTYHILIDTANLETDGKELSIDIEEDLDPSFELPELEMQPIFEDKKLESWVELLLKAVDSMCVGRYADVNALNTILNELDRIKMPWQQLLHANLVRVAEVVHKETFAALKRNADRVKASEQTQKLIEELINNIETELTNTEYVKERMSEIESLKLNEWPLIDLAKLICKWLSELETQLENIDELIPLRKISPYLASFNSKIAHLDVCSGWSTLKTQFSIQISQFLPLCRRLYRQNGVVTTFSVLSQNGKTYTYMMELRPYSMQRNRSQQLFSLLNNELLTSREVCRRSAQFALPDVIHTGRNYQIMECCPMSGAPTYQLFRNAEDYGSNLLTLNDIAAMCIKRSRPHHSLWQLVNESIENPSQLAVNNNRLFADWMRNTYPDSATHWMIRKKFTIQWALYSAVELACGLSSVNLKEMYFDLTSAQLFSTGYEFDFQVDNNGEFKINEMPQFRLTPNLAEYMQIDLNEDGTVYLSGHLIGCFVAATRALASRSYNSFLPILFWDLCLAEKNTEKIIKATQTLPDQLAERLKSLAIFTDKNFKALELLEQSAHSDAWMKISPSQHPWF